jgi:histidinol-phosphate aminotransferase
VAQTPEQIHCIDSNETSCIVSNEALLSGVGNTLSVNKIPQKEKVLYLDRNENQFGPAPECFSILQKATKNELNTYSRAYLRGVKSALSEKLAEEYNLPETSVLLSYGSEDMLKQIVHCYLGPGQTMMVPKYSWWYYKSVAAEVGGKVMDYPMHAGESSFYYDREEIVSLIRHTNPRIVLLASPNNPTGNVFSADEVKFLLKSFPETLVVLDEAYFGFSDSLNDTAPQLTAHHPNLAALRTFSKLYALAGMRIGHTFVGKNYQKLVTYSTRYLGYNLLSEQLALAALRDTTYYRSVASATAGERQRYYDFFQTVDSCTAYKSEANFILVKIPGEHVGELNARLEKAGIFIKFFSEPELVGFVRITIGTLEQNTRLIREMHKYFSRTRVLIPQQR